MQHDFYCHTQKLAVGYGGKPLLENIEIGVNRGQILTLIGPNGAGKSTLLKTIAGQLAVQGGTVYIDGLSITEFSGHDRAVKMALMLPGTRRTELTSCFDIAAAGRYPYTGRLGVLSNEDKQQVWQALKLVGAEYLAHRDFNKISDGQRQRILLARAICQQPELILLDEPTSFLDICGKVELLEILKQLAHERNVAVIVSLHELDLAQKVSDSVVCVSSGAVSAVGTPEQVFTAQNIHRLYGVTHGTFDAFYGGVELAKPDGTPEIFVIGGCGRGIPVYRRLQRHGKAFYAGILFENDIDVPAARALAADVVCQAAFEPISDANFERAKTLLLGCKYVVRAEQSAGIMNEPNIRLCELAQKQGKLVDADAV